MSLSFQGSANTMRHYLVVAVLATGLTLTGCGGGEEATQAENQTESQQAGEQKKDENPYGQALTSFVGEEKKQQPQEAQPQTQAAQPPATATYEKQLEDLRTENTSLKQRIVKLEQDNRTLNARLSDSEAKIMAEKERADKAETAAKSMPMTLRGSQVTESGESKSAPPMDVSSYEDALKAFNARQYTNAMNGLQTILAGGVRDDWADNCKYWIGECQFATKKYSDAVKSFEDVLAYKNSEKKADAQFMIAQAYDRLGKKAEAKEAYEKVVKDYPTSRNAKKAKSRWAKL